MLQDSRVEVISHVIQTAVAPVFLLTGIASMLGVLTNRLGRIIDRGRSLEHTFPDLTGEHETRVEGDLQMLSRRARYINRAISLFTTAALLVCLVIAVLFVSAFFTPDVSRVVAALFVLSMGCLIMGLIMFLREVYLATLTLRIGPH
jgi:predicted PurR-regulated permease PerM